MLSDPTRPKKFIEYATDLFLFQNIVPRFILRTTQTFFCFFDRNLWLVLFKCIGWKRTLDNQAIIETESGSRFTENENLDYRFSDNCND